MDRVLLVLWLNVTFIILVIAALMAWRSHRRAGDARASAEAEALKALERTRTLQQTITKIEESLVVGLLTEYEQQRLLATVAHELRTPLAVIDATAQNLELDDLQGDPVTLARYKKILRATARMTLLLKDSLNQDRFELLRQGVRIKPTEPASLLKDSAHAAWILSEGHHFKFEVDELPAVFPCDPNLMGLVLRSLADNAVKYTPPSSEVTLSGRATPEGLELVVADNGPGIGAADLPHLFEPFYRGQNVGSQPGTGLGLGLARRMMDMQGGTLHLDSRPGQGCRVTIFMPKGSV